MRTAEEVRGLNPREAIERLRRSRVREDRDVSIGASVREAERAALRRGRAVGGVWDAWDRVIPAHLREAGVIEGVVRGEVRVRVADAAARFEIDRVLRGGAESELIRAAAAGSRSGTEKGTGVAVRRVRLLG